MAMKMKGSDPWGALDEEFKENAEHMDEGELRDKIAQVTLNQAALEEAKLEDTDYESKRNAFQNAGAVYREGKKMNGLRLKFLRSMLEAKSKNTGDSGLEETDAEEAAGGIVKDAVDKLKKSVGVGGSVTISAGGKTTTIAGN